jgi:predicted nucleic acid-binding protein
MEKLFVDTNILVYFYNKNSPFHELALRTLLELSDSYDFVISTQTLREYAKVMSIVVSPEEAFYHVELFYSQFGLIYETDYSFKIWMDLAKENNIMGQALFDCNIAAMMIDNNVKKILTNNPKDFIKFKNEINIIPLIN